MTSTITASGPLTRWRTIDLLTCAFLGVAFGVAYWAWGLVYAVPSNAVSAAFPPLGALFNWPWLVAGIVGMLIIRRPGAAVFTELLAAVVSALIGTQWGLTTLVSGLVQGLGVELGFAAFGYAVYRWAPLLLGGFLGGAFEAVYEWYSYWTDWGWDYKVAYLLLLGASVAVLGSLLSVALTRGLASVGALNPFPPGQEVREQRAV
jgi:energy-coupling factor transport system substrate-specific component